MADKKQQNDDAAAQAQTAALTLGIFGQVRFKAAKLTETTYKDDRTGRLSKKIADVTVELGQGTGLYIPGKISAVKANANAPTVAEFTFFAAQNRGQAIKHENASAEMNLDNFRQHVCSEYAKWRKENATTTAAAPAASTVLDGDDIF